MTDVAIRAENVGKQYRIGAKREAHDTLRDALVSGARRLFQRNEQRQANTIWALQDVSFEVKPGEVIGVIGPNGAGKSTLLKILAQITEPTEGLIHLYGRVGSLLEVDTGFHPELTGRENIYLSGAILGMHKAEIDRHFDEIVAFAELREFLDTPVKRYSSGMYVRLAFAVAAHLQPEILLVDEVLAVGDAAFQAKCLGKMENVAQEGRTVLFVSHNLAAILHLCKRALVLRHGAVVFDGSPDQAIRHYLSESDIPGYQPTDNLVFHNPSPDPDLPYEVESVEVLDREGRIKDSLSTGDYCRFRITWRSAEYVERGGVEIGVQTMEGVSLIRYSTRPVSTVDVPFEEGLNQIECEFPSLPLASGEYRLTVGLIRPMIEIMFYNDHFGRLSIQPADVFQSGLALDASQSLLVIPHRWQA